VRKKLLPPTLPVLAFFSVTEKKILIHLHLLLYLKIVENAKSISNKNNEEKVPFGCFVFWMKNKVSCNEVFFCKPNFTAIFLINKKCLNNAFFLGTKRNEPSFHLECAEHNLFLKSYLYS
jgi:hypothetical protein